MSTAERRRNYRKVVPMTTETKYTHKHLALATRAHYGTSFDPERRGVNECKEFDKMAKELKDAGASDEQLERFESLFISKLGAQSHCVSTMIVGGSNFPVARAEKANKSSHNRLCEFVDYHKNTINRLEKAKYYAENPDELPIRNDDDNAKELLEKKIAELKANQEKMKACNKLIRAGDNAGLVALVGEASAACLLKTNCFGGNGYERFELTNNLANIKRLEDRLEGLKRVENYTDKEYPLPNNAKAVISFSQMRVWVEFDGKPSQEIIALMKSSGFKWTPSRNHWGRMLTGNAQYSLKKVISKLKAR